MIPGEAVYGVILLDPFFSFARFGRTAGECHHTQGKGEHNEELQADCLRRAASGWRRKERCAGRALLHPPALHSGRHLQGGCCCPEKRLPASWALFPAVRSVRWVIGNDVIEVYDELLKLGTFNAGQAAAPAAPQGQKKKKSAALFWTTWSASSSRWSPPLQAQAF